MNGRHSSIFPAPAGIGYTIACGLWIAFFLCVFFSQTLPNNPEYTRTDLWELILDELLLTDSTAVPAPEVPSGTQFLYQRFPLIRSGAILLIASWAIGCCLWIRIRPDAGIMAAEKFSLVMGLGLSIQSAVILGCGLAGKLSVTAILSPAALCLLVTVINQLRDFRLRHATPASSLRDAVEPLKASNPKVRTIQPVGWWAWVLILTVLLPFSSYLVLGSMSPQVDFDVREYHLQGPREWFDQGRITFLNHNVYTSFPFLTEMFLLAGMILENDPVQGALAGQVVLGSFSLLTCLCVFCMARRIAGTGSGFLAALICLTTPWTLRISIIAYAEGGLTFYLAVSVLALMLFPPGHSGPASARRWSLLTGFLTGSAMACKYTGLVSVVIPAGLILLYQCWHASTESLKQRLRFTFQCALLFAASAALAVGPWLARNLADTGNPVYPLAYGIFGGREWTTEMAARWRPAHAPAEHQLSQIPQHLMDVALRNDWTSGLLFALAVPALGFWWRSPDMRLVAGMAFWSFATWWAFTHRIDRFWIPAIPLLAVIGAQSWRISSFRMWKVGLTTVVVLVTIFNIRFCMIPRLIGFHAGLMDLEAAYQWTIRDDIRYLNKTLPASSKVLMVGEAEVFNAEFSLVYNTVFDDCVFERWTAAESPGDLTRQSRRDAAMRPTDEIRAVFAEQQITHVYVNWLEILRYRSPGSYGYTDYVQPSRFSQLVSAGLLAEPQTLSARDWDSFSPAEQAVIESWDGEEHLRNHSDTLSVVQIFEVLPAPALGP